MLPRRHLRCTRQRWVVLITTKRAKAGKTNFNLSVINGINELSNERKLLNGPQLLTVMDESWKNTFYSNPANANLPLPATPLPGNKKPRSYPG